MALSRRRVLLTTGGASLALPACAASGVESLSPEAETANLALAESSPLVDPYMGHQASDIRLNKNENPFGPSPRALEALRSGLHESHRYVRSALLRERLAQEHGVSQEHIQLGTGSGEILRALPFAFQEKGGHVVAFRHSYDATPAMAERLGKEVRWIDLKDGLRYDMEAFTKAIGEETRIVYLVNPNNPTGESIPREQIAALAESIPKTAVLVVDEAYVQFLPADRGDSMELARSGRENVLVTRTFSKLHGLAGLRIGYGVGHPKLIERIRRVMVTGPNYAAHLAAMAALEDHEHTQRFMDHAANCRSFYEGAMKELGIPTILGYAPLLLAHVPGRVPEIVAGLEAKGIFVRDGRRWSLPDHLRISYGTREQNEAVISGLRSLV